MQTIGSNSGFYHVHVRGMDKPIRMTLERGSKLSAYLTKEPALFVSLTDTAGEEYTVRTMTIDRVVLVKPSQIGYKTFAELGLPELS